LSNTIENPFFWIALLSALSSLGLYLINRRTFSFIYKKPVIDITMISTEEKKNGQGGYRKRCEIEANVLNPSSSGNHICGYVTRCFQSRPLVEGIHCLINDSIHEKYCTLPPFGKLNIKMYPDEERMKQFKNKKLNLIIEDISGRKIKTKFVYEDCHYFKF